MKKIIEQEHADSIQESFDKYKDIKIDAILIKSMEEYKLVSLEGLGLNKSEDSEYEFILWKVVSFDEVTIILQPINAEGKILNTISVERNNVDVYGFWDQYFRLFKKYSDFWKKF